MTGAVRPVGQHVQQRLGVRGAQPAGSQADHLCALSTDDNLWCWGQADHGQLGPTRADRTTPAPIAVPCP